MIHTERTQIINGLKVRITPAGVGDMLMIIYVQWCLHEGAQVQKKGLKNVCHKLSWELPNSTCFSQALILRWEFFPYHRLDLYLNHHASTCCVIFLGRCNRHIYHTHSHHAHTYHTYLYIPERELTTDQCIQLGEPMRFFFWVNVFLLRFLRNTSEELLMRKRYLKISHIYNQKAEILELYAQFTRR